MFEGMPDPKSADSLMAALTAHDDDTVRAACAVNLARFTDDPRVVDALIVALGDPAADVRRCAAQSLAECRGKLDGAASEEAEACLTVALRDPHIEVREQARAALDALGLGPPAD